MRSTLAYLIYLTAGMLLVASLISGETDKMRSRVRNRTRDIDIILNQ